MSSRLHNDFLASLGHKMRPYFQKQASKQTKIKTNFEHKEQGKEGSPRKTVGTPSVDTPYLTDMHCGISFCFTWACLMASFF